MESVVFEGKEYIKASVLAQKFRYTQDYLGQLCRGRKVDARLVGRAWYINLESLEKHRSTKYKTTSSSTEAAPKKASSNYLSRIDVEPVLKNKTVKVFREKGGVLSELPVRYEKDEYSLIPRVNKNAVSVELPILPAEAETLKVKKEAKHFTVIDFKPEALPEVYLSGSVPIQGLTETTEFIESEESEKGPELSEITSKIKPDLNDSEKRIVSVRRPKKVFAPGRQVDMKPVRKKAPEMLDVQTQSHEQARELTRSKVALRNNVVPVARKSSPLIVTEVSEVKKSQQITFSPDVVIKKQSEQTTNSHSAGIWATALPMLIFVSAIGMSILLLGGVAEFTVSGNAESTNFIFEWKNFSGAIALFR